MKTQKYNYGTAILAAFEYLLENYKETFVIGQGLWSPWYVGNSMTDLDKKFGKDNHFYGKTHSEEFIEKTRKLHTGNTYRLGSTLSAKSKENISKNNPNRKPINTPFGVFASSDEFAKTIGIPIGNIMRDRLDCKITKHQVERSKLFQEHQIGKTPRELGYSYVN
jgi:hypothetical protein